jgi:hypothetical protein
MKRIRNSKHQATLNLPTIQLEGSLFLPDQLEKAAQGRAQSQTEVDYGVPKGVKLKDEYSRAFQIACAQWQHFAAQLDRADVDAQRLTIGFVSELLRDALGYTPVQPTTSVQVAAMAYPVNVMAGRMAVLMAPHNLALDDADPRFAVAGSGNRKKSAFQAMQELLNASPEHTWGIVSNGKQLRLLRDAASLTRPTYLEFDLADLLGGQRYAEFANVWRLLHGSRAPQPGGAACVWEQWREAGKAEGTRVRDGLRNGVEKALLTFGEGFLQHPTNDALRAALHDGSLSKDAYFQQLLRLIYRLIFVFTVEERGVLHPVDDSAEALAARKAYAAGYALSRLRELCLKRRARNRHDDHWQAIRIVWRGLAHGQARLALPALGGLFAEDQCPQLDAANLHNTHMLAALQHLRWAVIAQGKASSLTPVDYRNMGPEELGSVYESLLELVPTIDLPARRFGFVGITEEGSTAGNARKTSGSYYTPDSLVQELIKSALDPVIEQRLQARANNPTEALLSIRVMDPACGSGHFLLAAARRLAEKLAELRSVEGGQEGAVRPQDYRHALREVVARCIFGVDRNPMAIELARTALWLEGFEEGRPLSFLDHHLQVGDALLGLTDLNSLEFGIAKDAFKPLSGDDKEVCRTLAKANTAALKQLATERKSRQARLQLEDTHGLSLLRVIEALPEGSTAEIEAKAEAYAQYLQTARTGHLAAAADALLGAYLLPKTAAAAIPTTTTLVLILQGTALQAEQQASLAAAQAACEQARVFHWPLAFPQIFAQGGFDCVLGNPPWEMLQLDPQEFFANRAPDVADAQHMAARDKMIVALMESNRPLYEEFKQTERTTEAAQSFIHSSGRFPASGFGRLNLAYLFAELFLELKVDDGRAGLIVPSGIATDSFTQHLFNKIAKGNLISFYDIENKEAIFESVHRSYKFCLLTLGKSQKADFVCFATNMEDLQDSRKRFQLTPEDFKLLNPNTGTCPVFRSNADAELTKKIYRSTTVLWQEKREEQAEENPWGLSFMLMFMMNTDSHRFRNEPASDRLPLYEAKLIHQFDHRWATYTPDGNSRDLSNFEKADPACTVNPRYWVSQAEVEQRLRDKGWTRDWLMGWRDITNATNERTVIASVIPRVGVGNQMPLMLFEREDSHRLHAALLANLCAIAFDFVARHKTGGMHMNYFIYKQLPVLPPKRYTEVDLSFIVPRVLELTYTSNDLSAWAKDLEYEGLPFAFDSDRRAVLRAELDAYYARLYGLTRDELRYILDPADVMGEDYPSETFRILKNKERIPGTEQYRTQQLVLAAWDALEIQQPITAPEPKPVRRRAPLPIYAEDTTPASTAEDWLAGLMVDVLQQAGPCDDNQLRRILGARLPDGTPDTEVLHAWLAPVNTERWGHICSWLRALLGAPVTAPLSIRDAQALAEVLGDHRTESLARALIAARRQQESALAEVLAGSTSEVRPDEIRKQG